MWYNFWCLSILAPYMKSFPTTTQWGIKILSQKNFSRGGVPQINCLCFGKKRLIDPFWTLACAPSVLIEKSTQNSKSIMYLGANDVKLDMLW